MIKYLIAFLLIASPCLAGMGIGGFPQPGPGVVSGGGGGPTILFYANTDTVISGQSPQVGSGTITISGINSTSGVISNSWRMNDNASGSYFPILNNIDVDQGTFGFYINVTNWGSAYIDIFLVERTTQPFWRIGHSTSSSAILFSFENQTVNISNAAIGTGTTRFIEVAWKRSTGELSYRLDGSSWNDGPSTATTSFAAHTNMIIGPQSSVSQDFWVDQIIISNGYKDDLYSIRNNTSF